MDSLKGILGANGSFGNRDARWVHEITKIMGREDTEVIVSGTLQMIGEIIATADRDSNGKRPGLGLSRGFGEFDCGDDVMDAIYAIEYYFKTM
jgi:hypothetical protein